MFAWQVGDGRRGVVTLRLARWVTVLWWGGEWAGRRVRVGEGGKICLKRVKKKSFRGG